MIRPVAIGLATLPVLAAAGPALAVTPVADPVSTDGSDALRDIDVVPANRSELSGVRAIEAGSTMLVRGRTNRRPDRAAIGVAVVAGPDADRIGFTVVESWGADGLWSAELPVPADVAPGTYTLRVRVGDATDYQEFEVVAEKRATLTVRTVTADAVVVDATLPDGGYVEVRGTDTLRGVTPYLAPGTHRRVSIPVEPLAGEPRSLTVVAVVGTLDRRLDAYARNGGPVAARVRLPAQPTPTTDPSPARTPRPDVPTTLPPTPTPRPTVTEAGGPGLGPVAAAVALVILAAVRFR